MIQLNTFNEIIGFIQEWNLAFLHKISFAVWTRHIPFKPLMNAIMMEKMKAGKYTALGTQFEFLKTNQTLCLLLYDGKPKELFLDVLIFHIL